MVVHGCTRERGGNGAVRDMQGGVGPPRGGFTSHVPSFVALHDDSTENSIRYTSLILPYIAENAYTYVDAPNSIEHTSTSIHFPLQVGIWGLMLLYSYIAENA